MQQTSIIAVLCALALGTTTLSAQDHKTSDVYIINGEKVENFDGSQLEGCTISSYKIMNAANASESNTVHFIETTGKTVKSISTQVFVNGKPTTEEDLNSIKSVDVKEIDIKGQGNEKTVEIWDGDETVFVLNEKKITAEEFNNIKPNKIKKVTVKKDAATISKYGEEGKTKAVILVETK